MTARVVEWAARPAPALRPFVWMYRGLAVPADSDGSASQTLIPRGGAVLAVELTHDCAQPPGSLSAASSATSPRFRLIPPRDDLLTLRFPPASDVVIVMMRPGGLRTLLPFPVSLLGGQWFEASEIWGRRLAHAPEQLVGRSPEARRLVLDAMLLGLPQQQRDPLVGHALARLRSDRGLTSVRDLSAHLGVGERRLRRSFDDQVGLAPKRLARLLRLGYARDLAVQGPELTLADIAHLIGYTDQAHLGRDTRAATGRAARDFMAEERLSTAPGYRDWPLERMPHLAPGFTDDLLSGGAG